MNISPELRQSLTYIYEEVMWLSVRPNVTPGRARAWYTHIMAESVKRKLRRFTGMVSANAADGSGEQLVLEHFKRIQTTLSELVERHRLQKIRDPNEFVEILIEYEQVHIVTRSENYAAMRAEGNYELAGIKLVSWKTLSLERRANLWRRMLRGRVANASDFESKGEV